MVCRRRLLSGGGGYPLINRRANRRAKCKTRLLWRKDESSPVGDFIDRRCSRGLQGAILLEIRCRHSERRWTARRPGSLRPKMQAEERWIEQWIAVYKKVVILHGGISQAVRSSQVVARTMEKSNSSGHGWISCVAALFSPGCDGMRKGSPRKIWWMNASCL